MLNFDFKTLIQRLKNIEALQPFELKNRKAGRLSAWESYEVKSLDVEKCIQGGQNLLFSEFVSHGIIVDEKSKAALGSLICPRNEITASSHRSIPSEERKVIVRECLKYVIDRANLRFSVNFSEETDTSLVPRNILLSILMSLNRDCYNCLLSNDVRTRVREKEVSIEKLVENIPDKIFVGDVVASLFQDAKSEEFYIGIGKISAIKKLDKAAFKDAAFISKEKISDYEIKASWFKEDGNLEPDTTEIFWNAKTILAIVFPSHETMTQLRVSAETRAKLQKLVSAECPTVGKKESKSKSKKEKTSFFTTQTNSGPQQTEKLNQPTLPGVASSGAKRLSKKPGRYTD